MGKSTLEKELDDKISRNGFAIGREFHPHVRTVPENIMVLAKPPMRANTPPPDISDSVIASY